MPVRVAWLRGVGCFSSSGAHNTPRAGLGHLSRGLAGLAGFCETVAVVPAGTARRDEKVLQRDETLEPDADLVLGPAEQLADLPTGKGDLRDRRGADIGPL